MAQESAPPPADEGAPPSTDRARAGLASMNSRSASANQEIFMLPRQKSRSRERRGSRMYLIDGQLCWATSDEQAAGSGSLGSKRHSSVGLLFGSSMDLSGFGQSMDSSGGAGSSSDEAISYRIKWCRENIVQLKRQTWPMEKKLQVLKASKMFIKQHQGELKQSKQAKDVIASTNAIVDRYWRHFKREFANLLVIITPWEMRIKKIESHFGSVVASYFTFLRWIFWLNLANSLVMIAFVMVPELIENNPDPTGMRKGDLGMQQQLDASGKPVNQLPEFNPTLGEMWEFEGFLKFSPIFYGYYSNIEISKSGFWRNPLAFLMSAILTYLFCFFCISRKLSQNTKMSRIGSKDDEYTFCWTVFVGWDFMIGNSETAYNKTSSLVMNLKEGILEEKEQTKDRDWRLIIRRVFANVLTLMLIVASAYVVTLAVQRSENLPEDASLLQKNELQLVMSGIQFMFPPLFDVIGIIEKYHPRKALSWQLGRILFLDFLNFYTLMFSLFGTVDQMGVQLNEVSGNITQLRKNHTYYQNLFTSTTTSTTPSTSSTTDLLASTSAPDLSTTTSLTSINTTEPTSMANGSHLSTVSYHSVNSSTGLPMDTEMIGNSTLLVASSPESEINMTASTLLTSILLASSTMMPSTSEGSFVTSSSPQATMSSGFSTLTNLPASMQITTSPSPELATSVLATTQPFTEPMFFSVTDQSTTKQPETKGQAGDEDYPDLGEVIKVSSSPKRRRRGTIRVMKGFKPYTDDLPDTNEVAQIERESEATSVTRSTSAYLLESRRFHRPPIQDPYGKLGRAYTPFPVTVDRDEDLEEPLEGRLVPDEVKKVSRPPHPVSPSSKPRAPGIARPIGGSPSPGARVQLPSSSKRPINLDDDSNEDILSTTFHTTTTPAITTEKNIVADEQPSLASAPIVTQVEQQKNTGYYLPETVLSTEAPVERLESTPTRLPEETDQTRDPQLVMAKSGLTSAIGSETSPVGGATISETARPCETTTTAITELPTGNYSNLKSSQVGFNASEVSYADCIEIPEFKPVEILALNDTLKDKLKTLCWETMFGQEMVKIVVMDLVMTVVSAVSFEFMRACFVRYCNRFFFWDLERGFPGYQDFKIAENVLHLVNNQSTVWMGMFFAPGLPAINTVKLAVLMYVRSWAVLTCNIPHETVFKVSKSNNFYYWILLINLLICILPVAYAVTWIRPSWHCGPFGGECRMYIVATKLIKQLLPPKANSVFKYLTSPGAIIPILISLTLLIYYLASTVSSSKEANKELKAQLKKDKEQEAAVPEITNTTVTDTTPQVAATASGQPVAAPIVAQQPSITSQTMPTGQSALQQRFASAALGVPQASGETRPKSLLVPPAM